MQVDTLCRCPTLLQQGVNISVSVRLQVSLSLSDQEICGYHPAFLSQECERRKRDKKTGESDVMVARQRETCKAAIKAEIFGTIPCLEHWKISGSKFVKLLHSHAGKMFV